MLGFPLPYRNELLYSTIARHGVHSGIVSPKELLQEVYGDTRIIATSDLPGHLNRIVALYPEKIGITASDLLYNNTLFPLYAPFIGEARRKSLIRELTTDGKSSVHLITGATASRVKQPEYLRYCPGCIEQQLHEFGECYWRRDWQVAGVDNCPVHGRLIDSNIPRHDIHRHQFTPVNADTCIQPEQQSGSWQSVLIARSINELLKLKQIVVPELVQWGCWYKKLAADHNLNRRSQIHHEQVQQKVIAFWGADWLTRQKLMPDGGESSWLRNMFRKHRKAFSYLEHLIVLHSFLEAGWKLADVVTFVARLQPKARTSTTALQEMDQTQLESYRRSWLDAVGKYGTKMARLSGYGDVYAWLYRHDRNWLMEVNLSHKAPKPKYEGKIDWHKRDVNTVKSLIALCNGNECRLDDPRRSKNWYLNQLKQRAGIEKHLKLLPLCSLFFDRYCENIFEYQIRRMSRTAISTVQSGGPFKRWQVLRWSGLSEERLTEPARRFLKEILGI
ncbi:TniQ family protein [Bowmanella sp. Y26]|uniref:TnsD family Tn7-like transposition protein n=1 Tax=Bowmanella yangjiangensis TaxID=2811230 RepID=UPI001BDD61CC|nr:TnsD family Tn7-like transposition protein [Bowmanella yangjiangensis]MBT1063982.1 TniQ family protein [Bowmanella yangjiangensis]